MLTQTKVPSSHQIGPSPKEIRSVMICGCGFTDYELVARLLAESIQLRQNSPAPVRSQPRPTCASLGPARIPVATNAPPSAAALGFARQAHAPDSRADWPATPR